MKIDCQWGRSGAALDADVAIIVDVMSFSTSVSIAAERGARIAPYWGSDDEAAALALHMGALRGPPNRSLHVPSLSPSSLMGLTPGQTLVLGSPNGARCSLAAKAPDVLCGCLRNAAAVAEIAASAGDAVLVVAAGEVWPDGSMRVAFEDLVGAGAIISELAGQPTPEAFAALAAFRAVKDNLRDFILACRSGAELAERGFRDDAELAAQLNVSPAAPMLLKHRTRYREALPNCEMGDRRVRYYEDVRA